jgi:molybdate transport system ATP-binding protein
MTHGLQLRLKTAFPGFDLNVEADLPGRGVTALFGPSGSGKTTCLRMIAGLERPSVKRSENRQSRVSINGNIWQDDSQNIWQGTHLRPLGFVFQEASLFDHLNVVRNLAYGQSRVPLAERKVSLEQAIELLGIGHLLQREPATLSGGERQRVAIARALATSPQLLLMDEPLAALDAQRKADVLPYLEKLHTGLDIPVLYVSHALDEVARLADHILLLDKGQVTAQGHTADLMTRLDLSLAHGDAAAAVIVATVKRHEPEFHLSFAEFAGGEFSIPQQNFPLGHNLRIRVQARDVSLTLQRQTGTSIQNILPCTVKALSTDGPGQVTVQLDANGSTLLARVTAKSAAALGLEIGKPVFAQIKGVAILG